MKQSTKLLSLVLALVMAFSCVGVIGNAALVKNQITYSSVDDAVLTPEQVADLALDLVDNDLLYGMEPIELDLSILGTVTIRLDSVDHIFADLVDLYTGTLWNSAKGLLGDAGTLKLDDLVRTGSTAYQRTDGANEGTTTPNLRIVYQLLAMLNRNKSIISKAVKGIGTDGGLGLGLVGTFLGDSLDEINAILTNLGPTVAGMIYDMLIYGSYTESAAYNNIAGGKNTYPSLEELEEAGMALPTEVDTLDEILNRAIAGLLTYPQDYEWIDPDDNEETDNSYKEWDEDSLLMPTLAKLKISGVTSLVSLTDSSNSFFVLLDKIAPYAIYDLGISALNNNLKKTLMEAVGVDFFEIKEAEVPSDVMTVFKNTDAYENYIAYDCLQKGNDGIWYYTTIKNVVTGEDDEGNEITERDRLYYRANTGDVNGFYSLVDWDRWNFTAPVPGSGDKTADTLNEINYDAYIAQYGSITESLNHILYVVYETALTDDVKADFKAMTGKGWVDGTTTACINDNLTRLIKYLLAEHADSIFGRDSAYVAWDYSNVANYDLVDLVAIIGPTFFEDAMPQLIMPQNANGTYAFGDSNQLLKFGAIVLREFVSEISPSTNYDAFIFEGGTVTSASGRQFANHTSDEWFNILLNMGLDVAYTYLNNLTTFGKATPAVNITEARWKGMLNDVIAWGADYVGNGSSSVLKGLDPNSIAAKGDDPLDKLSYVLNTLLPLGFVNGCTSATYDFDVSLLFNRIKLFFTKCDFTALSGLFGRNKTSAYNMLDDTSLFTAVLDLVDDILALVFGNGLLTSKTSLDAIITQSSLQTIVENLLAYLYNVREPLLTNGLPVLATFISDWGGEQEFGTPSVELDYFVHTNSSTVTGTFNFTNGSTGVWRGYMKDGGRVQDEQYKYKISKIEAYNIDTSASSVTSFSFDSNLAADYGASIPVTFTTTGVTKAGLGQRFRIYYTVTDEDGAQLGDTYYVDAMVQLDYFGDYGAQLTPTLDAAACQIYLKGPYAFDIADYRVIGEDDSISYDLATLATDIANIQPIEVDFDMTTGNNRKTTITVTGNSQYGITLASGYYDVSWTKDETHYINFGVNANDSTFLALPNNLEDNVAIAKFDIVGRIQRKSNLFGSEVDEPTPQVTTAVVVYDSTSKGLINLRGLVQEEMNACRTTDDYKYIGTAYADEVLVNVDDPATTDVYEKVTNFGTGTNEDGETVTVIDMGVACSNYVTALEAAMKAAYQGYDEAAVGGYEALYNNLQVAVNDLMYCQKTAEDYAAEGGGLDAEIDALEAHLLQVEAQYSKNKDYTDYMMYRWNRYNDARDYAKDIINKKAAAERTEDDLTKYFEYTSIYPSELQELVGNDKYAAYINALLEDYSAEEIEANREKLEDAKIEYALIEGIEVAQANNLLNRMPGRLISRGAVVTKYLDDEILAAKNQIGTENGGRYSDRSWANYIAAYNTAVKVQGQPTQMTVFDAKYELEVARNELVLVENEADYSELEALIAQATQALANGSLYDNTAKELGQVLAELGYKTFKNAAGEDVELFPGSAILVNEKGYSTDDQKYIDRAADALKEALANLKFKGLAFTGAQVKTETLVEGDEEEGIDAVTASVARIAALQNADAVKALFKATADNAGAVELTVSNDEIYTVDTALENYTGTNATVTFYTAVDGIKVPVATVKIVVNGDVNGDGVLDVLDGALTELVSNEHAELEGCYFLAANLDTATAEIVAADYTAVVNEIIAA